MVLRCLLCQITYNKNDKDIQMHKLPRKEHILKLWLSALNIEHITPTARLCSKHFTEQDFIISVVGENRYLKPNAVPLVNLKKQEDNVCSSSKRESIQNTEHCNVRCTSLKRSLPIEQSAAETPVKNIRTMKDIDIKKIAQSPSEAEACLSALIEELYEKQKEVKRFREKARKLQKRVTNLHSLLTTLKEKNLITNTARNTLQVSTTK